MLPACERESPSAVALASRSAREAAFLAHLPAIDRIAASVARRLDVGEREDFVARVRLKLIENDYAVLARFEGRSRLTTYLTCVVRRHFLDERVRARGRFRPSLRARRAGPLAVRAETLVTRDGLTRDEALATLRPLAAGLDANALRVLIDAPRPHLPRGLPRHPAPEAEAAACDGGVEEHVQRARLDACARRARRALALALDDLAPAERALLRARFVEGRSLARAAQSLDCDARRIYARFQRLLGRLRTALERQGVTRADAGELLGSAERRDPSTLTLDWRERAVLSACVERPARVAAPGRRERSAAELRAA